MGASVVDRGRRRDRDVKFFLAPSLDEDGRHFGSFGIVLALLAWVLVLTTITITTACAVFSPVWTQWRENGRRASKPREPRLKGT